MSDIEEIQKRIQQEHDRHQRKIAELDKQKSKEDEHHKITLDFLNRQKEQAVQQHSMTEFLHVKLSPDMLEYMYKLLDKCLHDIND